MRPDLADSRVELPSGPLLIGQPSEVVEIPDDGPVEWAPVAPYWAVLWRSGVALARELDGAELAGKRVVEVGCGLGVPSLVAARSGARVLATDEAAEALELLHENAARNDLAVETAVVDWRAPDPLLARAPFDHVLAADVLYEPESVAALLALLPQLGGEVWLADPGRAPAETFLTEAEKRWSVATTTRGNVAIHRLR